MKTKFVSSSIFTIIFIVAAVTIAGAQVMVQSDVIGRPIVSKDFMDVNGSQYTTADWVPGTVTQDGKVTKGLLLKYSELTDELFFKGPNDVVYQFDKPVNEFTLIYNIDNTPVEKHYRNGYIAADKNTPVSYYEVLTDGKTQLLRKNIKIITQNKDFGSANTTKLIQDYPTYYLFTAGKAVVIKKDKKSVFAALGGNKQAELENYIQTNKLNLKKDDGLAKLITVYNVLIN